MTGHSLGGGLAGFVGAIYGLTGVLFNNMTFSNAVDNAYEAAWLTLSARSSTPTWAKFVYGSGTHPYLPNYLNLSACATLGELLQVGLVFRVDQVPPVQYLDSHALVP